jgi:hypothetical protein
MIMTSTATTTPLTVTVTALFKDSSGSGDDSILAAFKTVLSNVERVVTDKYSDATVDTDGEITLANAPALSTTGDFLFEGETEVEEVEEREATGTVVIRLPAVSTTFALETSLRLGNLVEAADPSGRTAAITVSLDDVA